MEVVRHQYERKNFPPCPDDGVPEVLNEPGTIPVIVRDDLTALSSPDEVVNCAFEF